MLCHSPPVEMRDIRMTIFRLMSFRFLHFPIFSPLDYSCGKHFKERNFRVVYYDEETLGGPHDPYILVFLCLRNSLPLSVAGTYDLLLIWQVLIWLLIWPKWWRAPGIIRFYYMAKWMGSHCHDYLTLCKTLSG